jgi:isocitrate dehydrogenase
VWFRAKLDDNARLLDFTQKLEAACIGAVESGKMTKDLALLVHGSAKYVTAVSVLLLHSSASSACVHSLIFY